MKINECDLVTDVVKSVSVLVALRWVALAWNDIKSETITSCFRKAGVLNDMLDALGLDHAGADGSEDPFAANFTLIHANTVATYNSLKTFKS